ncbi:MAG: Ig-like domain-containing protein, partial [Dehalococcoidia bacterium]
GSSDSAVASVQVATPPPVPDETAPAQVTDLEVIVVNSDYVVLQWSAPGDDGGEGQADAYDVRYSTTGPLSKVNFDNATPVPVSVPSPIGAGGTERLNVTGLTPDTNHWFALRTADEVPNWSPVSNSVNATTLENATDVDATPPIVRITSPEQDSLISGTVLVVVEAWDDTGVEKVVILLDGILRTTLSEEPYLWAWSTADTPLGWHTLRAEASDPTGNIGTDEVRIVVWPPGIPVPRSNPPTVESLIYDPVEGRFDVGFSKPMNRSSVLHALSIEPEIAYQTFWEDDSNLTVVLTQSTQPDLAYTLTIAQTAADAEGTALAEAFVFGFSGVVAPQESEVVPDLWLPMSLGLAVGLATVLTFHLWSRRGVRRVRLKMRQLAARIEEISNTPQGRLFRELAELEGLASGKIPVTSETTRLLGRAR